MTVCTACPQCERGLVVVMQPGRKACTKGWPFLLLLMEMRREVNTVLQVLLGFLLEHVYVLIACVHERWINLKR